MGMITTFFIGVIFALNLVSYFRLVEADNKLKELNKKIDRFIEKK